MRVSALLSLALGLCTVPAALASGSPVFGSVVSIGGTSADIALDETRGVLYIADFGGHAIDVMSTATNSLTSPIQVQPWPGAIALSPDAQYLVVAHYCNVASSTSSTSSISQTSPPCNNAITAIHLADDSQVVYPLASPPLGVAFAGNGLALIVTTTNFLLFSPANGQTQVVATIANVAATLPVQAPDFPGQILQASLAASGDGSTVWGIASAGTSSQLIFQYYASSGSISATIYVTSPLLLPRLSVSSDGTYAMVSYGLISAGGALIGRYPEIIPSMNITGVAVDSANSLIYGQFPDANQPAGPGTGATPAMLIMDADNLTFRDRISIPEDMVGRVVLNTAATMMYAVSESGVMILPVGSLNTYHRVNATQEDLLLSTNFCNSGLLTGSLTIADPGGNNTDFAVTANQAGVTILPASGTTPATVQVLVDPSVFQNSGGTTGVNLTITSQTAVNKPKPVRLLVNDPDPSQHGTVIDQPGRLTDILPDQTRNRVYVARQDLNQIRVFDGSSLSVITTLRTATSPTTMTITSDRKYLLVGHDDSEFIDVFDLDALQPVAPILLPGGHFARSIAVSGSVILALARNEGTGATGMIDSVDFANRIATPLPTLGVYANSVNPQGVLDASPGASYIFYASPDGNVALYTAAASTFVAARQDLSSLTGAFAASDHGFYIAGNSIFDSSLVPVGTVVSSALLSSGFTFVDQGGYAAMAASSSAAGNLTRIDSAQTDASEPALIATEAPVLPNSGVTLDPAYGPYGAGSVSAHAAISFTRTVAPLTANSTIVMLTTSGLTVVASSYSPSALPVISAITSAADGSAAVASGGLISIYGQNLSGISLPATSLPLATSMGNACLAVNDSPIPLLYVSAQQINAQLPFNAVGDSSLTIHTANGDSNTFPFTIQAAAPSVFMTGAAGPQTALATIVRNNNNQLVTPTNPIHAKDSLTIFLTGMGQTSPAVQAGQASPSDPLAAAVFQPSVTLGSATLSVSYAGLAPGEVGVYQINATVPSPVTTGMSIPLVISQLGASTTLDVRVVN